MGDLAHLGSGARAAGLRLTDAGQLHANAPLELFARGLGFLGAGGELLADRVHLLGAERVPQLRPQLHELGLECLDPSAVDVDLIAHTQRICITRTSIVAV